VDLGNRAYRNNRNGHTRISKGGVVESLTDKQEKFLFCIIDIQKAQKKSLTYSELQTLMGFKSPASVTENLTALKKKGFVSWIPGDLRTLKVLKVFKMQRRRTWQ
jgi:SOS-response transcriptional repressor LexA